MSTNESRKPGIPEGFREDVALAIEQAAQMIEEYVETFTCWALDATGFNDRIVSLAKSAVRYSINCSVTYESYLVEHLHCLEKLAFQDSYARKRRVKHMRNLAKDIRAGDYA